MNKAIKDYFRSGHISMTPALSLDEVTSSKRDDVFPLSVGDERILKTFNGSAALHQVATALSLSQGDVVLLPAYCCGAEIGPFQHKGCSCEFFDVDDGLNADVERIETILQSHTNVKAVMVTHYFGFPQNNLARIAEICEKYDTALIEDCAHSLYSYDGNSPLGSIGRFAIFSPRKSLPLSEGGLMVANHPLYHTPLKRLSNPDLLPRWQRLLYSLQQNQRTRDVGGSLWQTMFRALCLSALVLPTISIKFFKKLPVLKDTLWLSADAEGEAAIPIYTVGMSPLSESIMRRANKESISNDRRHNYGLWLNEIERIAHSAEAHSTWQVKPLMPTLPEGCCPLYFPVLVPNPSQVKKHLAEQDVECFNWWQHKHEAVDWSKYPVAEKLKRSVVALPLHQQLNESSIKRAAKHFEQSLLMSNSSVRNQ